MLVFCTAGQWCKTAAFYQSQVRQGAFSTARLGDYAFYFDDCFEFESPEKEELGVDV